MKILITGCTAMQVNSPRKINDLISNLESLRNALVRMGHSVEWRHVDLGENLSEYDTIIASLAPFASWGTRYMGGVLWALASHPVVHITVDDWQVRGIQNSAATLWERDDYFEKTIWSHWEKQGYACGPVDYRLTLKKMLRQLGHNAWPYKVLVPAWEGGNLARLRLPGEITIYDPSPEMRTYNPQWPKDEDRLRAWVCASLTSKSGWVDKLRLTWPIHRYGNVREGQPKVGEAELAKVYANCWGVMSPPHDVSMTGWFRVRFWMALWSGSIVMCGDDEARILGKEFFVTPKLLETFSVENLRATATEQHQALVNKSWTFGRLAETLEQFLKA